MIEQRQEGGKHDPSASYLADRENQDPESTYTLRAVMGAGFEGEGFEFGFVCLLIIFLEFGLKVLSLR